MLDPTSTPRPTYPLAAMSIIVTACFIALAITNSIALDAIGLPIEPWLVFVIALIELAGLVWWWHHQTRFVLALQSSQLLGSMILVTLVTVYLVIPSLPTFIPPSRHLDAVHHVLLADAIFANRALPHDLGGITKPYFMSGYPAGGALFSALVAHWLQTQPRFIIHPLISFLIGLCAGITFLMICRLFATDTLSESIAFMAVLLLFTAWDYFIGAVNERYIYAQIFAQFFALGAFWLAYSYFESPNSSLAVLSTLLVGSILVTHPIPIVAPTLVIFALIFFNPKTRRQTKVLHLFILGTGLSIALIAYALPHWGQWVFLTHYGESVALGLDTLGLALAVFGSIGIALAIHPLWRAKAWFPLSILTAVLVQPLAVFAMKRLFPDIGSYQFEKSLYLMIYPLTMLASLPWFEALRCMRHRFRASFAPGLSWTIALIAAVGMTFAIPPRPFAPLTSSELQVAQYAKQHVDIQNVGIVSRIYEDAYWIQVIVFEMSPASPEAAQSYHLGSMTFEEWRGNPGAPDYALVRTLARVPEDLSTQTIYQYGESALLRKPRAAPVASPTPQNKTNYQFANLFNLLGYDVADPQTTGATLTTFYWQPLQWHTHRVSMLVQILDASGNVVARSEDEMFQKKFPTQRWPIGLVITDTWTVPLGADVPPGDYTIQVAASDQLTGSRLEIHAPGSEHADEIQLGPFRVTIPAPSADELRAAQEVNVQFGDGIALRAFAVASPIARPGESLRVTLHWASLAPVKQEYTVFVHLLDSTGRVRAQVDLPPQNGARPTHTWQPGEIIQDPYSLSLPKDLPPGTYRIEVGLYTPTDLKRVPVAGDDHIVLAQTITIR